MTLPTDVEYFEPILKHLEQTRGFDFTAYKPTSLMRRLVRGILAQHFLPSLREAQQLQACPTRFVAWPLGPLLEQVVG